MIEHSTIRVPCQRLNSIAYHPSNTLWTVAITPPMHGRTAWVERQRSRGSIPTQTGSTTAVSRTHQLLGLKHALKVRIMLRDKLNRGCLNSMLSSVLQQSSFLGSKGPSKHWSSYAFHLWWLALLVSLDFLSHNKGFSWECSCIRREWKLAVHRGSPLKWERQDPLCSTQDATRSYYGSLVLWAEHHSRSLPCSCPRFWLPAAAHHPWKATHRWNAWRDAAPVKLSQPLHINRIISCCSSIMYPNYTIYLEWCRTVHPCFLQKHFKFSL